MFEELASEYSRRRDEMTLAEAHEMIGLLLSGYVGISSQLQKQESHLRELLQRIAELEAQLHTTSKNSHKPPSTDGFKKDFSGSSKPKRKTKTGGQEGHKGNTLKMQAVADQIREHVPEVCSCCSASLADAAAELLNKRQEFELPPIKIICIEHQQYQKQCSCGHTNVASFPEQLTSSVQYGSRFKAFVSYLQTYQLLPYRRICELLETIAGHRPSEGTIANIQSQAASRLTDFEPWVKQQLIQEEVVHADETGIYINKRRDWLHVRSSSNYVVLQPHRSRGWKASEEIGILPHFHNILSSDCYGSYLRKDRNFRNALCNAHLLRELEWVVEQTNETWASRVQYMLCKGQDKVKEAKASGQTHLSDKQLKSYRKQWRKLVIKGQAAYPIDDHPPNKKGKPQKGKIRALLDRMDKHMDSFLAFLSNFHVPFDNNQAERDLRMAKVKQKISGCFRSELAAKRFYLIKSFVETARRQNRDTFDAFQAIFTHSPVGWLEG